MDKVTLTHPDLPEARVTVDARSVPHYARAGWVEAEDPPPEPPKKLRRRKPADDPTDD
jgi:hypothetical protein